MPLKWEKDSPKAGRSGAFGKRESPCKADLPTPLSSWDLGFGDSRGCRSKRCEDAERAERPARDSYSPLGGDAWKGGRSQDPSQDSPWIAQQSLACSSARPALSAPKSLLEFIPSALQTAERPGRCEFARPGLDGIESWPQAFIGELRSKSFGRCRCRRGSRGRRRFQTATAFLLPKSPK